MSPLGGWRLCRSAAVATLMWRKTQWFPRCAGATLHCGASGPLETTLCALGWIGHALGECPGSRCHRRPFLGRAIDYGGPPPSSSESLSLCTLASHVLGSRSSHARDRSLHPPPQHPVQALNHIIAFLPLGSNSTGSSIELICGPDGHEVADTHNYCKPTLLLSIHRRMQLACSPNALISTFHCMKQAGPPRESHASPALACPLPHRLRVEHPVMVVRWIAPHQAYKKAHFISSTMTVKPRSTAGLLARRPGK